MSAGARRFQIHACLGRGGFGEVYRATMASSGGVRTEVAVKVLRDDIDPGSEAVKRLRDEGRLLGALRHPAILRVHDLVLLEGRVALVTEFVEGQDLDGCLSVRGDDPIPLRGTVAVVGEVAAALEAAWSSLSPLGNVPIRLVHRDVKPANIRIGRHGEVKLLDFGIARATNLAREAQTATNSMMGSYLYMAPERFHDEKVAPPSDVYALGCILFEGLTRNRLFDGMTLKQIYGTMLSSKKVLAHIDARKTVFGLVGPEPRTAMGEQVPPVLIELLDSMLDPDPARRPTAADLARRCEDLAEDLDGPTLRRWARRRVWPAPVPIVGTLDGRDLTARSFQASGTPSIEPPRDRRYTPIPPLRLGAGLGTLSPSDAPPRLPGGGAAQPLAMDEPAVTPGGVAPAPVLGGTQESAGSPVGYGAVAIDPPSGSLSGSTERVPARAGRLAVALVAVAALIAIGGAAWLLLPTAEDGAAPVEVAPTIAATMTATPGTAPPPPAAPPVVTVAPAPLVAPAPAPVVAAAPAPSKPSLSSLRDRGWSAVDANPDRALGFFDQALAQSPRDADSLYGRGYALMKLGRNDEATAGLCAAITHGDERLRSEVGSVMSRNGLSCP